MRILVAVFACNEICGVRLGILKTIPSEISGIPLDCLLVDDGSTDGTVQAAREQGVEVLSLPRNGGKADAIKIAFTYCVSQDYDAVITMDADGQHDPAMIKEFIDLLLDGSDVVLGSRFCPNSPQIGVPDDRVFLNAVVANAVFEMTGARFHDVLCGFRGYSMRAVLAITPRLKLHGYGGELEAVVVTAWLSPQLAVCELPIPAIYRGTADMATLYSDDQKAERLKTRLGLHTEQLAELFLRGREISDIDLGWQKKSFSLLHQSKNFLLCH